MMMVSLLLIVPGYLVSVMDGQSNAFSCIVECRAYKFALYSTSSCVCTSELIESSQLIGNENCPVSDGVSRGVSQSNTVAVYMYALMDYADADACVLKLAD